ncbi:MAG: hypothetical protein Kow00129_09650 [Thermoleophilia bacterium]
MTLRRRIILLNAAILLATVGIIALGTGYAEQDRAREAGIADARAVGAAVAAGLEQVAGVAELDPSAFFASVEQNRHLFEASGAADPVSRRLILLDEDGFVVASNGEELPGTPLRGFAEPVRRALAETGALVVESPDAGGRAYCVLPLDIPGLRGALLVEHLELNDPTGVWKILGGFSALGLGLAALLLAVEAGFLTQWFSAPLLRMTKALEGIGWGDFSVRLSGRFPGELAAVSAAFDEMAERLDELGSRRRDLEQTTEALGFGVVMLDAGGRIRWLNRQAMGLLGGFQRSVRGIGWAEIVGDKKGLEQLREAVERGEEELVYEDERLLVGEDGEEKWLGIRMIPLGVEGARPQGYGLVLRDLKVEREWSDEQRRLMSALSEANRLKTGVLRLLSGDLGARLAALAGQDWEARDELSLLAELSQVEGTYLRALVQECPLAEVVQDAIQRKAVLAATRGTNLQVMVSEVEVMADREGLARCVGHLIGAALYVAEGPVRVRAGSASGTAGQPCARVDVEVLSTSLSEDEIAELAAETPGAGVLEAGPETFGLALFLAVRYSLVLRVRLQAAPGEAGGLVLSALVPLSPMSAAAGQEETPGVVSLSGAVVDALTGLASRPILERALAEEVHRAGRLNRNFSLMALEVNDLSLVIHRHGRTTGDRIMREVGEIVRRTLRKTDLAARTKANTISILLPDTRLETGQIVAEKIRWAVSRHIAATPANAPIGNITVTVALVGYPQGGESAEVLKRRLEQTLDRARRTGMNKVALADDTS